MIGAFFFVLVTAALSFAVFFVARLRFVENRGGLKLALKGHDSLKSNEPTKALRYFSKACLAFQKENSDEKALEALNGYCDLARSIVIEQEFNENKGHGITQVKGIQAKFRKIVSEREAKKDPQASSGILLFWLSSFLNEIDGLVSKAENHDLDAIVNEAFKNEKIEAGFLIELKQIDEVSVRDLATKLSYSSDGTAKLLQKNLSERIIDGYLSYDGKEYMTKECLRNKLLNFLKNLPDNSYG